MTCGNRVRTRLAVLLVGAALALLGSPASLAAQSQATTGIIRGVVSDPTGVPVANAQVILHETQTNFTRTLTTDAAGNFTGTLLPLGTYDATARAVGFAEVKRTGISLGVGETVDLRLSLAAVTLAPVTVEATRPVVDVTKAEASTPLAAQVVSGLPNNGRNFLNLTLLTPNVATVQGPDGDELTVAGQRGIHNNVSVDGADFNNPFFGEQRGGQRPPFTFNLDAVQEVVVTAGGATAEFGRSSSGFVNVITKSGTNEIKGSLHYFGKYDWLSADLAHGAQTLTPDFRQHQFGFTLGGPLKRDKAFFFIAYDQQVYDEIKQKTRPSSLALDSLTGWMDTAFAGALRGDFGPISRTNDARAGLVKIDWRLSDRHNLSLKYNYTWSQQENGTFDVDAWGRSANGIEKDHSNAGNLMLASYLSPAVTNEFRFQYSREDRPRPYGGARSPLLGPNPADPPAARPFPDTGMDFGSGFRFGMPFFLPIDYYDTRIQMLDNVSIAKGDHLIKFGAEWNRVNSVQTFIGFANSRYIFASVHDFFTYQIDSTTFGPLLYLQQAGVNRSVREAGTQSIPQHELAVYLQDAWRPNPKWTVNYGLRWEAQVEPGLITPKNQTFYAVYYDSTVTNAKGTFAFPSDGTIPSDWKMFQPRLGLAFDPDGSGRQVFRGSAGLYYARIPGLNLASSRSTDGARGFTYDKGPFTAPAYGNLFPDSVPPDSVKVPGVFVFDKNFRNPRTFSATVGYERQIGADLGVSVSYTHARTDHLTRFFNANDPVFNNDTIGPWATGPKALGTLTVVQSTAKSRYNAVTIGLKRVLDPRLQFQLNYTLSFDKSDDDNERDPFTFRYAQADSLQREYNWSDRDQRHRFNGWLLAQVAGFAINNRVSISSAQPVSEQCGVGNVGNGQRAASPQDRICRDGTAPDSGRILLRNTLRKDNAYFSWDVRVSRAIPVGRPGQQLEAIVEVFNVTNNDNFKDPAYGGLLFNFDGTIRSGLGDPRQFQAGVRWVF